MDQSRVFWGDCFKYLGLNVIWFLKNSFIIIILMSSSKHDYQQKRIPNINSIGLIVLGLIDSLIRIIKTGDVTIIVLSVIAIMLFYTLLYAVSSGGIGGGDIKLLMGLGLCIGFWSSIECFVIAALLFVAMRLMEMLRLGRITGENHPFAPYLLVAYIAKLCIK